MRVFLVAVLVAVALAAVVAAQNVSPVTLAFFGWRSRALPLSWVVIGAAITGAGLASLFWVTATLRISMQAGRLKAANRKMEKELAVSGDRSEKV